MQARTASVEFLHASRNHSRTQIRPNIPDAKACRAAGRNSFTPTFVWHTLPSVCCLKTENGIWRDFLILEPQAHWPTFVLVLRNILLCIRIGASLSYDAAVWIFDFDFVHWQQFVVQTMKSRTTNLWYRLTIYVAQSYPQSMGTVDGGTLWRGTTENKNWRWSCKDAPLCPGLECYQQEQTFSAGNKFQISLFFPQTLTASGPFAMVSCNQHISNCYEGSIYNKKCAWARVCRQCVFMCCFRFLRCLVVVRRLWLHIFSSISFNIST